MADQPTLGELRDQIDKHLEDMTRDDVVALVQLGVYQMVEQTVLSKGRMWIETELVLAELNRVAENVVARFEAQVLARKDTES